MSVPQALVADRYRLVERVGSGGMGVVWEAWDERLERRVALKQLRTHAGVSEEEAELAKNRAMREARITARLHHRHAVPVFDVVEHEGQPCLIMQFVPSVPLSAVLKEGGPLSPAEAARLGAEVASALAAAHQLGIVHRDVKPGNILVADDGHALISDFGISHALGDATLTSTGLLHGTPAYLAPEVARGAGASEASDVHSLGATLYAALEGQPPYGTDSNSIALLHRVASGEHPAPQRSGALAPLVERMLSREPGDRPTMRAVADELAALAARPTGAGAADDPVPPTLPLAAVPTPAPAPARAPVAAAADETPTRVASPVPPADPAAVPPARPPAGPVTGRGDRPDRPRRRRPLLPLLLGLVAVLAVAALAFALLRPDGGGAATPRVPASESPAAPAPSDDEPTGADPTSSPEPSSPEPSSPEPSPSPSASPTPSPSASPTRSPSPRPEDDEPTAAELAAAVRTYYGLVPDDTDEAWTLLTRRYQTGTTGGRDAYENFWDGIEEVAVSQVRGTAPDGAEATVTYTYDDDRVVRERTSFRLVPQRGVLKIDDSTVISSTG